MRSNREPLEEERDVKFELVDQIKSLNKQIGGIKLNRKQSVQNPKEKNNRILFVWKWVSS